MRQNSLEFFNKSVRKVIADHGRLPVLNGEDLVDAHPASVRIFFGMSGASNAVWQDGGHSRIVFTHGMGCYPTVQIYDSEMRMLNPDIEVLDGRRVMAYFGEDVSIPSGEEWCFVAEYMSEYGSSDGASGNTVAEAAAMTRSNMIAAQGARDDAVDARDDAHGWCSDAMDAYEATVELAQENAVPTVTASTVYVTIASCQFERPDWDVLDVKWTEPNPVSMDYGKVHLWAATIVVANFDHMPTSVSDGTVLEENTVWNAHKTTPLSVDMDGHDTVYIKWFTRMFNGQVSNASDSPGRQFVALDVEDLDDFMRELRAGNIEQLKAMFPVGSTLEYVSHSTFTNLTYLIAHYDYKGHYGTIGEYLNQSGYEGETWGVVRYHDVILVPQNGLSNQDGTPASIPYDLPELMYAPTQDTEFDSDKTYYVDSTCTEEYTGDTTGSPVALGLNEKGRALPVYDNSTMGCGMYHEAMIRQWLTSFEAAGNWYAPWNIFEPASHDFTENNDGFLRGFDEKTKTYLHRAHVRHDLYDGTQVVTWDMCFLPNKSMVSILNEDAPGRAQRLEYYDNMTAWSQRGVRSVNGSQVYSYTGDNVDTIETVVQINKNPATLNTSFSNTAKLIGSLQTGYLPFICLA